MARLDTYGANAALTWMERLPVWQGGSVKGLSLFAIGNIPNGAVLLNRVGYVADTASIVDADPGAGNVRWNNATQASATVIYISDADSAAADHAALWATVTTGGYLYLANAAMTVRQVWQVTSVTDAAGYIKLGVTLIGSNGSFADNDVLELSLQQPSAAGGGVSSVNGASGAVVLGGESIAEPVTVLTPASGVVNIDCSLGDYFTLAPTANVTSITFSNLPAAGKAQTIMVRFTQDTTARTVAWPASFKWAGGMAGAVSTGSGAIDVQAITTFNQGTTWMATLTKAFA